VLRPVHRARIEPYAIELAVKDGQTIFRAANEAGLRWPTRCSGAHTCTMCTMIVDDGVENLSKPDEVEAFRIAPLARHLGVEPIRLRMACAARVRGPVVVSPRYQLGQTFEDEPAEVESP
jgi:ferredoxin, 2Fe-2S